MKLVTRRSLAALLAVQVALQPLLATAAEYHYRTPLQTFKVQTQPTVLEVSTNSMSFGSTPVAAKAPRNRLY